MRRPFTFFAVAILAMGAAAANAGVILDQETTANLQTGATSNKRTIMIEGNKQKVIDGRHTVITDLDRGLMIMIDPGSKTYMEMPFPPTGRLAAMMQGSGSFKIDFKKTDKQKTVSGYKCLEYVGSGHMTMGDYTVIGCFSKNAPGAAAYTAFDKAIEGKLKGTPMETGGERPEGVPLILDSSTRINPGAIPGLPPEQAKEMAHQPPHTTTTRAISIKAATLPASTFAVPAGYTKRELPAIPEHMGAPAGGEHGKPESSTKIPE